MYDPDDRRSEWTQELPRPTETPRLVEYEWVNQRKPEKGVSLEIIESVLANLGDDDAGEDTILPRLH